MLAKCPECGNTILIEDWGYNYCKFCKKDVWITNPANPQAPPLILERKEETKEKRTFIKFSKDLFLGILKSPKKFFREFEFSKEESKYLFYYGVLALSVGFIFYFQLQKFSYLILETMIKSGAKLPEFVLTQLKEFDKYKIDVRFFDISTIFSPLLAIFFIFFSRGIFFIVKNFGKPPENLEEFQNTMMDINFVVSAGFTSWIFWVIPIFGMFYSIFLFYRGLTERLKLSSFKTIISLLLQALFINFVLSSWIGMYGWLLKGHL